MADEDKKPSMGLEVQVGNGPTTKASFDAGSSSVSDSTSEGAGMDFNPDGSVSRMGLGDTDTDNSEEADIDADLAELDVDGDGADSDAADETGEADAADETTEGPADGDPYDPSNEEVVAAFDKKYTSEDGSEINFDAFEAEVRENMERGVWDINKSSREYLKDRFGINGAMIDSFMRDKRIASEKNDAEFYSFVGGEDAYKEMLTWGSSNYTPAQKDKFNKALKAGGDDAREQLELLIARAQKAGVATPKADTKETSKPKIGVRRPASPKKDVTANSSSSSSSSAVEPFKDADAHRVAMNQAATSKDPNAMAEVRKRLLVSPWFKAQK